MGSITKGLRRIFRRGGTQLICGKGDPIRRKAPRAWRQRACPCFWAQPGARHGGRVLPGVAAAGMGQGTEHRREAHKGAPKAAGWLAESNRWLHFWRQKERRQYWRNSDLEKDCERSVRRKEIRGYYTEVKWRTTGLRRACGQLSAAWLPAAGLEQMAA